ncbi:MAG: hypothetical protein FWG30_05760 [Eubacteriaceae bacterium]|nr:hypothetical protein [Eubacteriaceae bacterium]
MGSSNSVMMAVFAFLARAVGQSSEYEHAAVSFSPFEYDEDAQRYESYSQASAPASHVATASASQLELVHKKIADLLVDISLIEYDRSDTGSINALCKSFSELLGIDIGDAFGNPAPDQRQASHQASGNPGYKLRIVSDSVSPTYKSCTDDEEYLEIMRLFDLFD